MGVKYHEFALESLQRVLCWGYHRHSKPEGVVPI